MSNKTTEEMERDTLGQIEAIIREARGENIKRTPWDYNIPTGQELRYMRERCNMTRNDVASELDYSEGYISAIETGSKAPGRGFIQTLLVLYKREWPRNE